MPKYYVTLANGHYYQLRQTRYRDLEKKPKEDIVATAQNLAAIELWQSRGIFTGGIDFSEVKSD